MRGRLAIGLVVLALCGCATEGVSVHRLPDETPAADKAAAIAQMQAATTAMGLAVSWPLQLAELYGPAPVDEDLAWLLEPHAGAEQPGQVGHADQVDQVNQVEPINTQTRDVA